MNPTLSFDPIVYVVDDEPAILDSVSLLIRSAGLRVMAFPSALEFLAAFIPNQIACLVLDIRMPGTTGLELQAELEGAGVTLPIVFVTGHGDVAQCTRAFKAGASDFLTKPIDGELLLDAIRKALRHCIATYEKASRTQEAEIRLARLSGREREVLELVTEGMSSKEIGTRLGLSPRTIEAHRASLFDKLEVNTLAELIKLFVYAIDAERAHRLLPGNAQVQGESDLEADDIPAAPEDSPGAEDATVDVADTQADHPENPAAA